LYHDIGKVDISPEILNKPGALTTQEFEIIKRHTQTGCEKISEAICVLIAAYWITRHHHERGDGTGYYGLAANEIHPFIRLVSVADVLDALLSKRSYKKAWGLNEALDYLKNQSGVQFDKEVISVLLDRSDDIADLYR
jgi:HD-GYP domain-containing protein (c-di-GMP phosphodiesterase class II)